MAIIWGDWKNINKYYPTLLYMAAGNLLYLFLYGDDTLWNEIPDVGLNNKQTILLYSFTALPCGALLFLSTYPNSGMKKIVHTLAWIAIFSGVEYILHLFGKLEYNGGWNAWLSTVFNCLMFPMLRLHYKKPIIALCLSIPIVFVLTLIFTPRWDS